MHFVNNFISKLLKDDLFNCQFYIEIFFFPLAILVLNPNDLFHYKKIKIIFI